MTVKNPYLHTCSRSMTQGTKSIQLIFSKNQKPFHVFLQPRVPEYNFTLAALFYCQKMQNFPLLRFDVQ